MTDLTPGQIRYREYLKSDDWKRKKAEKDSDPYFKDKCDFCFSEGKIHHHHLKYRSWINIDVSRDLVRLCPRCHHLAHILINNHILEVLPKESNPRQALWCGLRILFGIKTGEEKTAKSSLFPDVIPAEKTKRIALEIIMKTAPAVYKKLYKTGLGNFKMPDKEVVVYPLVQIKKKRGRKKKTITKKRPATKKTAQRVLGADGHYYNIQA